MAVLKIGLVILYVLSPLAAIFPYFRYNWYSFFHSWSLAAFLGICSYWYLLNQFITGSRLKWIDRLYGYDRALVFHRNMAIIAVIMAIAHRQLRHHVATTLQIRFGALSLMLFVFLSVLAILFLSQSLAHLRIVGAIRKFLKRRFGIGYQHFRAIHNITAIAMLAALVHVLLASSTRESPVRAAIMTVWFVIAIGSYLWTKLIRPRQLAAHPCAVKRVEKLSPNITTIWISRLNKRAFNYAPGSFSMVRVTTGNARGDQHPFTMSSPGGTEISFTIKDAGDWTHTLQQGAQIGDTVIFEGPYGRFSYTHLPSKRKQRPYLFIAGGIGVTPFMAMLDQLARERAEHAITFVWSVRSAEQHILKNQLTTWKNALPHLNTIIHATSGHGGHDISHLMRQVDNELLRASEIYFCCPSAMHRALLSYLRKSGARRRSIHYESFNF